VNALSSRLFQGVIHQMKEAIDRTYGVVDLAGTIIACSELSKVGENASSFTPEVDITHESTCKGGNTYKCIATSSSQCDYVAFVEGQDELAKRYVTILAVALGSIKHYYDEKYDRTNFIKNVILDNILTDEIYLKAKEFRFANDASRVVLLIRMEDKSDLAYFDTLSAMFPDKQHDFVININESNIVIIKEVYPGTTAEECEQMAASIYEALQTDAVGAINIGIGTVVDNMRDLSSSFREAQISLEVGKVFDEEKNIIHYENLGIGRLIYQLPTTLCEMFLKEVFRKGSIDSLDNETLHTIQKFFENNLNVSETSRKLFVHRNTLVYRLEKICKLTGLDLREFDHAIVFKIALMVKRYLSSHPVRL
jgi:carbohydrate diacid regulator